MRAVMNVQLSMALSQAANRNKLEETHRLEVFNGLLLKDVALQIIWSNSHDAQGCSPR